LEPPDVPTLLEAARSGDQDAFRSLTEPHRRELQVHCYRMLGSLHDAEDLVQETLLRAWRGLDRFEGRASFRSWLYRIATNACLNAIASRKSARRLLPETYGPPVERVEPLTGQPPTEIPWLEPYPDAMLEGVPDSAPGPDARYDVQESVQLAFVAAIQHLPPRQRAVLLLRDVLGWSAAEAAALLESSVPSVNSALQRARATLAKRLPDDAADSLATPDADQRALLDRYVHAWERTDLDALVSLLREEAVLSMPPWPHWFAGRAAIREILAWAWSRRGCGDVWLVPTRANGQPAWAQYHRDPDKNQWQAHSIWLPAIKGGAISGLFGFISADHFAGFGLPTTAPIEAASPGTSAGARAPDRAR
jgi:RNA polymerase sigma-70 factor (ECF subfamily)